MAVSPGITVSRRLLFLVAAIICFVIDCFFEFAKISVQANVIYGLLFLGLAFFAAAFL